MDGALALAIPTKFGQDLMVKEINSPKIYWNSLDENGELWFSAEFIINDGSILPISDKNEFAERLHQILNEVQKLNRNAFSNNGFEVTTSLNFPKNWGLGTSSTLINNISQWLTIDAYELLKLTFGGSGYDIACAQNNSPITYSLKNNRQVALINFEPCFKENLYFVYLNRKQNSRDSISSYKSKHISKNDIEKATKLTNQFIACQDLNLFIGLLDEHENLIGRILDVKPIKKELFSDFSGGIKSLGGWGGDFILVASEVNPTNYFRNRGFDTILPYSEMVLK